MREKYSRRLVSFSDDDEMFHKVSDDDEMFHKVRYQNHTEKNKRTWNYIYINVISKQKIKSGPSLESPFLRARECICHTLWRKITTID